MPRTLGSRTKEGAMGGRAERSILSVVEPVDVVEGAGVMVHRALPSAEVPYERIDPFLLLAIFDTPDQHREDVGFPRHPHRGFEIITYLLKGAAGHADDLGNRSVVHGGGLQKITAGRGMWHEEGSVAGKREPTGGLQLWINLAQSQKGIPPEYQALEAPGVPVEEAGAATVRTLVGEPSPIHLHTPTIYLDVTLPSGGALRRTIPRDYQGFVYVRDGRGEFGSPTTEGWEGQLLLLGPGEDLSVRAPAGPVRFMLAAGKPHREPILWSDPFVD